MSAFSKLVVLFTLALSASALATPHAARSFNDHHALLARKAAPAPEPFTPVRVVKPKRLRRRGDNGRCIAASSSQSATSTTSSSSSESTAQIATAVANVAQDPSVVAVPTVEATTFSTQISISSQVAAPVETPAPSTGGGSSIFGNFFSGTNAGDGTFYDPGLGACGFTNGPGDYIAAAAKGMFDNVPGWDHVNPNNNPVCNKEVIASFQGKSVRVKIVDRCDGCENPNSLDFSPSAFAQLADAGAGRIQIDWVWA